MLEVGKNTLIISFLRMKVPNLISNFWPWPKCGKRKRKLNRAPGGADAGGWEEYFDYIFPEDEGAKPNLKLLAMAKMWKKKKEVEPEPETESSTPEKEMKEESDTEEERISISEEIPTVSNDDQNLDADDEDIKNESSDSEESSDESDDENDEPKSKQRKKE